MGIAQAAWDEYDSWNSVIADVVFPPLSLPVPVYLDLEDDTLAGIGHRMGVVPDKVAGMLGEVCARTSWLDTAKAFETHEVHFARWRSRGDYLTPPPILPLLSVFSLAAERMASGDGMSANNYYGRLAELLGAKRDKIGPSYSSVAETFWGGLNLWLASLAGRRGLPTASSVGFRYVGLAISQAIVREADRRRLERFFVDFDLAPRSDLPPSELVPLLDAWMSQLPCPATHHLANLWKKKSLQDRIAGVVATELAEWDGTESAATDDTRPRSRAVLVLEVATFPRRLLRLMPLFFVPQADNARAASLRTADQPVEIMLVPSQSGAMTFNDPGLVDPTNLLEGRMLVSDPVAGDITRSPKRLVVFRKDELSGRWIEARQVLMGDEVTVLVADGAMGKATSVLGEVARPGWTTETDLTGLPQGWSMLSGLEIFSRPIQQVGESNEFSALVPLTSTQLKLAGGMALPGALRNRWHSRRAPEARAVTAGVPFALRLVDLGPPDVTGVDELELGGWSDEGSGSVIVDLSTLELTDGDYAVEMLDAGSIVQVRKEFALRSSDSPDLLQREPRDPIVHHMGHPLAVLGADPRDARGPASSLVHDVTLPAEIATSTPAPRPWWDAARDEERRGTVRLARPEPGSCFYTGHHRIELGMAMLDQHFRPVEPTTPGRCSQCGLEKRYSSSYYKNARKFERQQRTANRRRVDTQTLPPVPPRAKNDRWDVALDCLRYAGGGSIASLERVARQIEPSRVFLHEFVITLEALGHIEVLRSSESLEAVSWEISPSVIIDVGRERVLTGDWSGRTCRYVLDRCRQHGRCTSEDPQPGGPKVISTDATNEELLEWLDVSDVLVAGRAGLKLANSLPALSKVLSALPRRPVPAVLNVQWFDPRHAAWRNAADLGSAGAYRVGRYTSTYFLRATIDVENGEAAVGDAYLAKHAASVLLSKRALLAYHPPSRELIVPLGANLPGMYQRAAVLDSGLPPLRRRGYLIYRGVSPEVAGRLTYLLEN